jgi:hypothetical protein
MGGVRAIKPLAHAGLLKRYGGTTFVVQQGGDETQKDGCIVKVGFRELRGFPLVVYRVSK